MEVTKWLLEVRHIGDHKPSHNGTEQTGWSLWRGPQTKTGRTPIRAWSSNLYYTALIALFSLTLWYCLDPSSRLIHRLIPLPSAGKHIIQTLGLYQGWSMFTPTPYHYQAYVTIEGKLTDGTTIDLMKAGYGQGGWRRTRPYYDGWYYSRWVKITALMAQYRSDWRYFPAYGQALCRSYNTEHQSGEPQLSSASFTLIKRDTPLPGKAYQSDWRREELFNQQCF